MENKPKLPTKRKLIEQNPSLKISRITRFSDLPNAIIQHILSFCTVKDAVKVCTLSRHWNSLWTSISNLLFCCNRQNNITDFAAFVDRALSLYSAPKVKTFLLEFPYGDSFRERVKSWICFSLTHGVEELYLHILSSEALYPNQLFDWFNNWCGTSLKVISLARLLVDMEMIEVIFCGNPLLEFLKLEECNLISGLGSNFLIDATNTSLKNLVLDASAVADLVGGLCEGWVEIRGPDLVSLTLKGYIWKTNFKLVHLSSLVEANIDPWVYLGYNDEEDKTFVKSILENLLDVSRLAIRDWYLQVLQNMGLDGDNFSPFGCKILEINVTRANWCYSGMEFVLQNSSPLEQLIINMSNVLQKLTGGAQVENVRRTWKLDQPKELKMLIEELEMVLAIKEQILHFPRSSPDAVVVFKSGLL